jgi:hypothetical protein
MGQHTECEHCFFRFDGGHSHHTGASVAICTHCLSRFRLPTENLWGPAIGEHIPLLLIATAVRLVPEAGTRRRCHAKHKNIDPPIDTGVFLVTVASPTPCELPELGPLVNYPIEQVACPQCSHLSLRLGFERGDLCPQCNSHSLSISQVIY